MIKLYKDGTRLVIATSSGSTEAQHLVTLLIQDITNGLVKMFKSTNQLIITLDDASGKYQSAVKNLIHRLGDTVQDTVAVPALKPMPAMNEKVPDLSKLNASIICETANDAATNISKPLPSLPEQEDPKEPLSVPDFIKESEENETTVPETKDVSVQTSMEAVNDTEVKDFHIEIKPFEFMTFDELIIFFNSETVKSEMDKILERYTFTNVNDFLISSLEGDIREAYTKCLKVA